MQLTFSIVIPVMNGRVSLEMVFRCLAAQTFPRERFECIVVDDGSTDGTAEFLRRYHADFNLRTFFHPSNLGRSQARNTACRYATGEIIIFLDADMLAEPGWLAAYDAAFADGSLDVASGERYHLNLGSKNDDRIRSLSRVAAAPPEDLMLRDIPRQFENLRQQAVISMYPTRAMQKFETQLPEVCRRYPESLLCAYSFISSNVAVRRSVFEKTSGYDPGIRRVHDTELGIRFWEMGARIQYAPGARAYHMYYTGQGDRDDTLLERMAVFYRHPYCLSILLNLWFAYHEQADPHYPTPAFESLLTLTAADPLNPGLSLPQEFQRVYGQPFPADCVFDLDFMIEYYCEGSGIPRPEIQAYLERALARGLIVEKRDGQVYFDIYHTTNWLRKCTTFQQYEFLHTRYIRSQKGFFSSSPEKPVAGPSLKLRATAPQRKPFALQCHGVYTIDLPLRVFPDGKVDGTLNIALPIEHACQTDVQVTGCVPENLLDYADAGRAIIRAFPLQQARRDADGITLRYEFTCRLREYLGNERRPAPESPSALTAFLRPTYPPAQLAKAQAILKKIFPGPVSDPYTAARMIYFWVLDNTVALQGPLADYAILDTSFGPCIHQTRLFVNLCRLLRIPVREQCGIMFGRSGAEQTVTMDGRGHTFLNHTWAELYTPTRGWTPMDFGACMGQRLLTAVNVSDETLRAEVIRDSQAYDDYYFGHMDPFRLYVGAEINKLITCPIVPNLEPEALKQLIYHTHHHMTCEFSFVEE